MDAFYDAPIDLMCFFFPWWIASGSEKRDAKAQAMGCLKLGAPDSTARLADSATGKHQRCVTEHGRNA